MHHPIPLEDAETKEEEKERKKDERKRTRLLAIHTVRHALHYAWPMLVWCSTIPAFVKQGRLNGFYVYPPSLLGREVLRGKQGVGCGLTSEPKANKHPFAELKSGRRSGESFREPPQGMSSTYQTDQTDGCLGLKTLGDSSQKTWARHSTLWLPATPLTTHFLVEANID